MIEAYRPLIKILLILLSIGIIIFILKAFFDSRDSGDEEYNLDGVYTKKPYFFSQSELKMYYLLRDFVWKEYSGKYAVFPKVGLQDFLYVNRNLRNYKRYYNKIGQKHIDFLIVDQNNHCDPVLAIELNGTSHETEQMERRDELVKKVYNEIKLEFMTFQNKDLDNSDYITEKIKEFLYNFSNKN